MTEASADRPCVLVVDDDPDMRSLLEALLAANDIDATSADSVAQAMAALDCRPFDLVLTDLRMPGEDGLALLRSCSERWSHTPVILMTAHGSVPVAVEAMRAGAADFVLKPLEEDELIYAVRKAAASVRHQQSQPESFEGVGELLGGTPPMRRCAEMIRKSARTDATVLLRGESGTGKELAARAIHSESRRADAPFVKVHCGALPEALLESELFGYEKGAFTGAVQHKPGRVDLAMGGTLFLDEIGDISSVTQVKLLRLLQDREYERLGGTEVIRADVRFVAATHQDLERLVAERSFREDLFYRLNIIAITMPPLRDRRDDIPLIVRHALDKLKHTHGQPDLRFEDGVVEQLSAAAWPGNVRQLLNVLERVVVLSDTTIVRGDDVRRELGDMSPAAHHALPATPHLSDTRMAAELAAIETALKKAANNRTVAARILGVSRRTLYNKLKAFDLLDKP